MAHKTKIDGTEYEITGGKCLIGGTAYKIKKGRTRIGGTGYDIEFVKHYLVTISVPPSQPNVRPAVYAEINDNTYGLNLGTDSGATEFFLDEGTLVRCKALVGTITHDGEDKGTSYEFEISSDIKIQVSSNGIVITTV